MHYAEAYFHVSSLQDFLFTDLEYNRERRKKEKQLLELVQTAKPIACSIVASFCIFFIKTHFLSSQALSNFDLNLFKDTAFTTL